MSINNKHRSSQALSQLRNWLTLIHMPGVGPVKFARILEIFPDLADFFQASPASLRELGFLTLPTIKQKEVDKNLAWLEAADNHFIITLIDPLYPWLLQQIHDPPPILFVKGDPALLTEPQLAIVGSRNPTVAGSENARQFAHYLANAGLVITSGLALGIDASSHEGALIAQGKTIAVLGTGLDQIYPKKHQSLAQEIVAKGGTLISELPIGTPARPENFPRRNRIISGMSQGVLVVEATIRSGSLITARLANEQGREVFAIPGSIHNPLARGCHVLLRQGAKLVETVEDVLEEYQAWQAAKPGKNMGFLPNKKYNAGSSETKERLTALLELDEQQYKLLQCLDLEPVSIDTLVERSQLSISDISSMLLLLELHGHVQTTTAGYMRIL